MMIPLTISAAMSSWAAYYGDHQWVSVSIRYFHLAALIVGAGTAVSIDRQVIQAWRHAEGPAAVIDALRASHRVVVPALVMVVASGVLMAMADWTTFAGSQLFWIKMGFVSLLLVNGAGLVAVERAHARRAATAWRWLVVGSGVSLFLWLFILWLGAWLAVAA
jgi:hypothetical protein